MILAFGLLGIAVAQLPGTTVKEMPPPVPIARCTKTGGCKLETALATLDANWRWVHSVSCSDTGSLKQCYSAGNCYTNGVWDTTHCEDPESCAKKCAVEGV